MSHKNKLIITNTMFLATRTIVSLCISFYTTRIVLHQLGVSDFGLYRVIYGVVGFFIFIVSAMNDSVQRFISVNLDGDDVQIIKNTFKNSLLIYISMGVVLLFLLYLFSDIVVLRLLNIQQEAIHSAKVIYLIALLSIFISIVQTPFNALVLAHEKMSFYAYMTIFDSISKLLVSFLIVVINYDKVVVYSVLLFITTLLVFFIYITYCYANFKKDMFGGKINLVILKEISMFSFWNVFGNFSYVCRTQGINIAINIFFATTVNAAYAISTTVLNAINSLTQSLITAIKPQIFKTFADNNSSRYTLLINNGAKFSFSLLFVLSCPILVSANKLLSLWLVDIPPLTTGFVRLIIIVSLIDSFSSSLITGIQATGRIKVYQLIVGFFVFISLPITFLLYHLGFSVYSTFIPLIITSVVNLILRLYFITHLTMFSLSLYLRKVVFPCVLSAFISISIAFLIEFNVVYSNVINILFFSFLYSMLSFFVFFALIVTLEEKKVCFNYVLGKLK